MSTSAAAPLLVSPKDLSNDVVFIDASWHMPGSPRNAVEEYKQKHIAGARYLDLDVVASENERGLKHMMPTSRVFARAMGKSSSDSDERCELIGHRFPRCNPFVSCGVVSLDVYVAHLSHPYRLLDTIRRASSPPLELSSCCGRLGTLSLVYWTEDFLAGLLRVDLFTAIPLKSRKRNTPNLSITRMSSEVSMCDMHNVT
jgi:hypothetical protein